MLGKKWKPKYIATDAPNSPREERSPTPVQTIAMPAAEVSSDLMVVEGGEGGSEPNDKAKERKKKKKKQQKRALSTKGMLELWPVYAILKVLFPVLADVVESLIGAAYLHGGFDLGYECIKFFDLGVKWQPIASRLEILARVQDESDLQIPPQIADVEAMFGYTFNKKILLLEALTHASYQEHTSTISYERLEFIGDSVLDMIVTDYLYHAPGKEYSPGHIHLRRSSVVNGHFLAYICLGLRWENSAIMPQAVTTDEEESFSLNVNSTFVPGTSSHETYLWQCLLHSSDHVLDDLNNTFTRYQSRKDEIREALDTSSIFPWAALTRLQAPKFFSDIIESIIGAAYIDSQGNMDAIRAILRRIGILPTLERIVRDDVSVLHPVSRLSTWAQKNGKEIEYEFIKERGNVVCVISVDGAEEVRETERYRGLVSQEEVKFAAAEKAIHLFKLRGIGIDNTSRPKTRRPKKKKNK
jgi:endoribonuclease Dicer